MRGWLSGLGGLSGAALTISASAVEVLTLTPVADTALFELSPTNNLGAVASLPAGTINQGRRSRVLLWFDPASALPPGAWVTSVSLEVTVQRGSGPASAFALHRVLAGWEEGTGGAEGNNGSAARPGEATWERRIHPDVPWTVAGGASGADFVAEPSATLVLGDPAEYVFASTPALVADVQRWLDQPGSNHGWILLSQDEATAGTSRRIGSREDLAVGPRLVVEFLTVAERPRFDGIARLGDEVELRFRVEAGRLYAIEHAESLPSVNWTVLGYAASKFHPTNWVMTDAWLPGPGRFYRLAIVGDVD